MDLYEELQNKIKITHDNNFNDIFKVRSTESLIPLKTDVGKLYLCSRSIINYYNFYNIDHIISMVTVPKLNDVIHDIYEILDDAKLDTIEKMKNIIEEVLPKIHQSIMSGNTVAVHCFAGVSRSATIVIAYLMKYENYSFEKAIEHVFEARPVICPNIGFLKLLKEFK